VRPERLVADAARSRDLYLQHAGGAKTASRMSTIRRCSGSAARSSTALRSTQAREERMTTATRPLGRVHSRMGRAQSSASARLERLEGHCAHAAHVGRQRRAGKLGAAAHLVCSGVGAPLYGDELRGGSWAVARASNAAELAATLQGYARCRCLPLGGRALQLLRTWRSPRNGAGAWSGAAEE
jgi:hypothetical protein